MKSSSRFQLTVLGFAMFCLMGAGGLAALGAGSTYDFQADPFSIHNTSTATVGYVKDSVVSIQVTMGYLPADGSAPFERKWSGSGLILSKDGEILTNWHVADDQENPVSREYRITLFDGREFQAAFVRSNMSVDLAILQILGPPQDLVVGILATYDPVMGQDVLVFGSPRGLQGSVSHGIVSALDREICVRLYRKGGPVSSITFKRLIQIDAPINPGNSGGPATDIYGRVIGLVNAGGSSDGIGFAVSILDIRAFLVRP